MRRNVTGSLYWVRRYRTSYRQTQAEVRDLKDTIRQALAITPGPGLSDRAALILIQNLLRSKV